jgi:hypothetical protein
MTRTVLLATAMALALTAGGASAAQKPVPGVHGNAIGPAFHVARGAEILYNQNSTNSDAGASENFTSGSNSNYDSAGADDFVVPKKQEWTITEVDASGVYFNGNGTCDPYSSSCDYATSENVIFYTDNNGVPGNAVKGGTFTGLTGTDDKGNFFISLGKKGMKLKSGHYWVSVVANMNYANSDAEWGWEENFMIYGYNAQWENPKNGFGFGCTTWENVGDCVEYNGDFAFDLQGQSKKIKKK